ncbi:enolase-phosphatase E1-like [Clinocottus analis]|uniref:enolase-phosphatase E1-like n=1 Tax=Clinocottus analis TaxID=304258 RepID=UPI0035BF9AAA
MGAKEDWRGWTEFNFKKVQRVQEEEDVILEDHQKESEQKLTQEIEQSKLIEKTKMMEIPNMPTEHVEEKVIVEQIEQVETRITEKEESQLNKTDESRVLSDQKEETNEETQQTKDRTVEHKQGEELDSNSQTQASEQQSHKIKQLEIHGKDLNKETENQVAESKHTNSVVENLTEVKEDADAARNTKVETQESVYPSKEQMSQAVMKPEESTETEHVQQTQVDSVTTETSPGSETDRKVKAPSIKDPTIGTEKQQQEVITETDNSSRVDAFEEKYHCSESIAETETKEESHTQTVTETNQLAQTQEKLEENTATQESESEIVQMDPEQHIDLKTEAETLILCSPQCIQPEGADLEADTETEAEIPVANDTVLESSKECDTASQEEDKRSSDEQSEAQVDQTQAEETPTETESTNLTAPSEEEDVTQAEARTQAGPDGKTDSVETEVPAPGQLPSQVTISAGGEEESTETVQGNAVGEDDVSSDRIPEVQDKDSRLVTADEPVNSGLTQAPGQRSSRSSGDFCIRKSSNSCGSRLARRLSEDLFIMSVKTSPSQSTPNQSAVQPSQLQSNPVNPTQSPSDRTSEVASSPAAEMTPAVQPKRFGLFRRLRGEQVKKAPKMQIPKILIQDYSDGAGTGKPIEEEGEERLSSRERRRRRRDRERKEKEEERLKKKREKELGKQKERERRKPQTRGQSFQVQREKGSSDVTQPAKTGSQRLRYHTYAESYF